MPLTSLNSYITRQDADLYFTERMYSEAWTAASSTLKETALISATRRLEREQWVDGSYLGNVSMPSRIREACCELAIYYLKGDPSEQTDDSLRQFKRLHVAGAINLEMRDVLPDGDDLPTTVWRLIAPYLATFPGTVRLVRA